MPLSPRKPDHQIDPSWSLEKRIWWALEAISDRCDGARKLDGAGYSKYDRPIADRLQGLHLSQWAAKDVDEGLHLIRKYRRQLESMGISVDDIIGDMGMVVTMDDSNDTMDIANRINSGRTVPIPTKELVEQIEEVKHPAAKRVNVALEDDSNSSGNEVYCEFLTGSSGTGKTFEIRRRITENPNYALLTATTGIAAINLGTITLNSALGYYNTESLEESMIKGYLEKKLRDIIEQGYENICIDEISMQPKQQTAMIFEGIRRVNERSEWHNKAKLGMILTGDFCQLPPIPDKVLDKDSGIPWAFKANCFDKFEANTTRLTKFWRQSDVKFLEAINLIRHGNGRDAVRILKDIGIQFSMESDKGFDGTTILSKNDAVDGFNFVAHSRVNGTMIRVNNTRWGKLRKEWDNIPAELSLKIGSLVMVLVNDSPAFTYVNGDCGHVRDYQEYKGIADIDGNVPDGSYKAFTIELKRNGNKVEIGQITRFNHQKDAPREIGEDGHALRKAYRYDPDCDNIPKSPAFDVKAHKWIVGAITYYPLRLAYASTVHKSQGLSLDNVQIDVNNRFFGAPAMAYVALSRARTPEGLRIVGTPDMLAERVKVHPEVLRWL